MDYRKSIHSQLYFSMESALEPLYINLREIYPDMRHLIAYYQMMVERFQPSTLEENLLNDYANKLIKETH